jgi:hypothetical protein
MTFPNHGEGLRLVRAAAQQSLNALSFAAHVSRHRLFESEKDRLTLTPDEVEKVAAVLLQYPTVRKVLDVVDDLRTVQKITSIAEVRKAVEILKVFARDPELTDRERSSFAAVLLRLERRPRAFGA